MAPRAKATKPSVMATKRSLVESLKYFGKFSNTLDQAEVGQAQQLAVFFRSQMGNRCSQVVRGRLDQPSVR